MNALIAKALAFAAVLIIVTIVVVKQMNIDLSDPINLLTMIGAIAIAVLSAGVSAKYIAQMKTDKAEGELAEENWDGIGEYKNELPAGWAYSFLGTLIWALWYWQWGYPVNAYSQIGEWNKEVKTYNKKFEEVHKNPDKATLKEMGESIFLVKCAPCHGTTGDGLSGKAQDFGARMSKEQILHVINNGQNQLGYPMGAMPAGMATGKDAEEIATYIAGGMKGSQPASFAACASCHGADGKGNNGMAPNLAGYDLTLVQHVLEHGKKGMLGKMPSFKTTTTPVQEKALAEFLQSLNN
ncbi:MAG: c-type cytochrome [Sulfurovum sp.]|nr:c-type cytochrome [Sulfurovum sp.]MCB4744121.1 c-type cytochrome [Sulfurovum sp.]MCB4746918.1 c-type cytochrome [Sulfurovum sp.]MCB4749402.1 c-type cytochrome [Sulfurovum sp.]MCB4750305.1 c-type cytochrome [Sulfurovum sp.]